MAKQYVLAVSLILATPVWALPTDRDQPITINADRAIISELENRATYEGAVAVTQGTFKISGDIMVLTTNATNAVEGITATGAPARFESLRRAQDQAPVSGRAAEIIYTYASDRVILKGEAEVSSENSFFSGPEITYDLSTGEVVASGDRANRVNMTMQPKPQRDAAPSADTTAPQTQQPLPAQQ